MDIGKFIYHHTFLIQKMDEKNRNHLYCNIILVEKFIKDNPGCTASLIFKKTTLSFPTANGIARFLDAEKRIIRIKKGSRINLYPVGFVDGDMVK